MCDVARWIVMFIGLAGAVVAFIWMARWRKTGHRRHLLIGYGGLTTWLVAFGLTGTDSWRWLYWAALVLLPFGLAYDLWRGPRSLREGADEQA